MILVDTPVWIDHLALPDPLLARRLDGGTVLMHPFVIGEIMLGNLRDPAGVRETLGSIKSVDPVSPDEALEMIVRRGLAGSGVGYVDAHLLASTLVTPKCSLWTRNRRLHAVAKRLGVAAEPD